MNDMQTGHCEECHWPYGHSPTCSKSRTTGKVTKTPLLTIEQENQRLRDMLRDAVVLLHSAGDEQAQGASQSGTAWWHEQASELDSALSTNTQLTADASVVEASNAEPPGPTPDGLGNDAVPADKAIDTPETDKLQDAFNADDDKPMIEAYCEMADFACNLERQRNAAREDAERLAGELKFVLHELEVASTSVPSERMSIMDELIRRLPGFAALESHSEESK